MPRDAWQRTVRCDSYSKELVRYIAELELGPTYGPTKSVCLVAATLDPAILKPESTWYLATSLPLGEVSAEQVYEIHRLRDGTLAFLQAGEARAGLCRLPDAPGTGDCAALVAGDALLHL